jgi:Lar family restriction alleviation protein
MDKLKRCPFCGSEYAKIYGHKEALGTITYNIGCFECCLSTPKFESLDELKNYWNTRKGC